LRLLGLLVGLFVWGPIRRGLDDAKKPTGGL